MEAHWKRQEGSHSVSLAASIRRVCPLPYLFTNRSHPCHACGAVPIVDTYQPGALPLIIRSISNISLLRLTALAAIGALASFARSKMGIVGESPHGRKDADTSGRSPVAISATSALSRSAIIFVIT